MLEGIPTFKKRTKFYSNIFQLFFEFCSISALSCSFEFVWWVGGGGGGIPSDNAIKKDFLRGKWLIPYLVLLQQCHIQTVNLLVLLNIIISFECT